MKDIIEFPVVGTRFSEGGMLIANLLQEGSVLTLIKDPTNVADKDAIKVMALGETEHIGFVPNKGMSCSLCWTHIGTGDTGCPSCGAGWDYVTKGGLATRLVHTNALEKPYACYVKEVIKNDKFAPIMAKIVLE